MSVIFSALRHFTPRALVSNLARTAASEYEQGVIRVLILVMVLSFLYYRVSVYGWIYPFDLLTTVLGGYLVFSIVFMWSFLYWREGSTVRRTSSLMLDLGMTTFAAWHAYDQLFQFFWVYQWLCIGYGARYGRAYLVGAVVLGAGGFSLVSWRSGNLFTDSGVGAEGLIFALVLIPLFVASLIGKVERARREAEEANRAKSTFLANMSHEMRTPLYGVVGSASLMDPSRLDAEHRECVETILASAQTLQSVIEDVLDLSKIEAGKTSLEVVECDLHQLVRGTARMLQHQAKSKGLSLDVAIADSVPRRVNADVQHLRQVLVNLIGNAIKFTDTGHVDIRVSRRDDTDEGANVLFEVRDTGIGISDEARERIFESFTQADESTTRRFGGTGLGTTIAKQLVELMGGSIGVESEFGVGSRFWFLLPIKIAVDDSELEVPLTARHMLVVSGVDLRRQDIAERAAPWVQRVTTAATHAQALSRLIAHAERHPQAPAIMVLDAAAVDDAAELVRGVRSEPMLAGTQVVSLGEIGGETEVDLGLPADADTGTFYRALQSGLTRSDGVGVVTIDTAATREVRSLKVLVVDDQAVNRRLISRILERAGHDVTTAPDGETALDLLEPGAFDGVVIDMMMPTLSGLDVIRSYRFSAGLGDSTPFVVLSGNATIDAHRECKDAGADAFLTKPVDRAQLLATLDEVVERVRAHGDEPAASRRSVH